MCHNHSRYSEDKSSTLIDKTKQGKERPWRDKKIANVGYYELLHLLEFKKAERVSNCGEVLEFDADQEGRLNLARAWFCKSRLCAMCNWRRMMKHSVQSEQVIAETLVQKPKARFLFLTLTSRNAVDGESLNAELTKMTYAFRKMMDYKKVKKNLIGFMRTTEVTVNEQDGTYNQHMHVLLCVESTYFKDNQNYIKQAEWTSLWKKALQVAYTPIVHVQAIKPKNKEKSDLRSAIDETAKYPVKDSDYLTNDQRRNLEIVEDLEKGLFRKRMLSYGGLLKQIHKEMNLDDEEEGDLIHTDTEQEISEKAYSVIALWNWHKQDYFVRVNEKEEGKD